LNNKAIWVPVRHTKVVDLDLGLYSVSEWDFDQLRSNLAQDPYLGTSDDGINHEYLFMTLKVHYIVYHDHDGVSVLITGLRPPEAVSWGLKAVKVGRKTVDLVKEIKGLFDIFGGGN
jgi:hypothetical protein